MPVIVNVDERDPVEVFILKSAVEFSNAASSFVPPNKDLTFVTRVLQVYKGNVLHQRDFPDGEIYFNKAKEYAKQLSSDVIHVVDNNDGDEEV